MNETIINYTLELFGIKVAVRLESNKANIKLQPYYSTPDNRSKVYGYLNKEGFLEGIRCISMS